MQRLSTLAISLALLLPFSQKKSKVSFDCSHNRLDQFFKKCVQKRRLLLVLLKDKADAVTYLFEGKTLEGLLIYSCLRLAMPMQEVQTHVKSILGQSGFLLDKEICILCHTLVCLSLSLLSVDHALAT